MRVLHKACNEIMNLEQDRKKGEEEPLLEWLDWLEHHPIH